MAMAEQQTSGQNIFDFLGSELKTLEAQGLYKHERYLTSAQGTEITVGNDNVINMCANNYLGLASHPQVLEAAHEAIDKYGFGMASVRFICGTTDVHRELETRLAKFVGQEDSILFPSCYAANTGIFEALLGPEDAIISDELNHACIIDGIRLCKAKRYIYKNNDMNSLEEKLKAATEDGARFKVVVTDGVFSMEGTLANLEAVCDLAEKYGALKMIDDSHATGFMGKNGYGTHEHFNVMDRIDIVASTLGKGLGGSVGGFIAAKREITEWLRNKGRTYLFSNAIPPTTAYVSLKVLDMLEDSTEYRDNVINNGLYFREKMEAAGLDLIPGEHPIIPVKIGDAAKAQEFANKLMEEGVYVIGFSYPVVPQGKAVIRTQMSAAHTQAELDAAVTAFEKVGRELGHIAG